MTTEPHGGESEYPSGPLDPHDNLKEANEKLLLAGLREQDLAAAAHQSAEKLRAVLDNMTEGVTVFDRRGEVVLLNPVARAMLGLGSDRGTADDYRRLDVRVLDGTPLDFDRDALRPMLEGTRFADTEVLLNRPGHGVRHLVASSSDVRDVDGEIELVILVVRDVTDLRNLEQIREQYAALITHDLRGPLSTIKMAAQLLLEGPTPERCRSFAVKIERSLDRMDRMIGDLLDAQRIRAGKLATPQMAEVDIFEIAREVREDLGNRVELRGESSVRGVWSAEDIRRAIWNLASNGLKYGRPDTPVTIEVSRHGDVAVIAVHNEGTPIPRDELPLIFEPFVRSHSVAAQAPRGWGLGLTLVRGAVEAHHGSIHVDSDAATGTTFTMTLPITPPA
ncbi:MAG: senX3 [Myxococcales bacterium]|nr:senX3 [Myxococcales bacterium]